MSLLSMGVVGTAKKENELRAPIHPDHLERIDPSLRERIFLETGYGERFGWSDEQLLPLVAGLKSRDALFATSDIILLPKPTDGDFDSFHEGQILWGWPHCVQGPAMTQIGIDKKMTQIAWEAMHYWKKDSWELHVFHKNNELAGYASVLHALQLKGITGHYGSHQRACVISCGSAGRGAIHALKGLGFGDVTLFTQRPGHAIGQPIPSLKHWQFRRSGKLGAEVILKDETMTMAKALGHFDVIVNCIFQDTDAPFLFVDDSEISDLKDGSVIIDVSCDDAMGFSFAKPTSFESPSFTVDNGRLLYYAVDHSPSYLWNSTTFEISEALLPFVSVVMGGPEAWKKNTTIQRAIEIQDGVIQNEKILNFQHRSSEYPHPILESK